MWRDMTPKIHRWAFVDDIECLMWITQDAALGIAGRKNIGNNTVDVRSFEIRLLDLLHTSRHVG